MVEITIVQGKLEPDMKTFEAESEMLVEYHSLDDALNFAADFARHARPQKIISRTYDSTTKSYIEYETVRLYQIGIINKDVMFDMVLESVKDNIEKGEING